MGGDNKTNNEVLVQSFAITATETEDVLVFVSTGAGEVFGVKVSIQVCCQESLEDRRYDLINDTTEAITKTMVGMYRLTKKLHSQEYKGTLRLTDRGIMEGS